MRKNRSHDDKEIVDICLDLLIAKHVKSMHPHVFIERLQNYVNDVRHEHKSLKIIVLINLLLLC